MTARPSGAAITVSGPFSSTVAPLRRAACASALDLARDRRQVGKQPAELAFMGREQNRALDRLRTGSPGASAKTVMASASSTTGRRVASAANAGGARPLADAGARSDQDGVAPLVLEQAARRRRHPRTR